MIHILTTPSNEKTGGKQAMNTSFTSGLQISRSSLSAGTKGNDLRIEYSTATSGK
jgi:hypothetical protein